MTRRAKEVSNGPGRVRRTTGTPASRHHGPSPVGAGDREAHEAAPRGRRPRGADQGPINNECKTPRDDVTLTAPGHRGLRRAHPMSSS